METDSAILHQSSSGLTAENTTLNFREITNESDLEKSFMIRFEIYSESRMQGFLKHNPHNLDLDVFDLHSRHFGLYTENNELAGHIRIVLPRNEYFNYHAFNIGKKTGIFSGNEQPFNNDNDSSAAEFPILSYPCLPESVVEHFNSLKQKDERLAEAGRIVIAEKYRGIRTSVFLVECALVLYILICAGQKHAVITCCKEHHMFYERYGFRPLGNGMYYQSLGTTSIVLGLPFASSLAFSNIPKHLHQKLEEMVAEFSITGEIKKEMK